MRAAFYIPLCLLAGCISTHQSAADSTSAVSWSPENPAEIRFCNSDTVSPRDISILLHHSGKAAPDSITLHILSHSPAGSVLRDTFAVRLERNPLTSDIILTRRILLSDTLLPEAGEYVFEIAPSAATRGVWGAGLDFSKTK